MNGVCLQSGQCAALSFFVSPRADAAERARQAQVQARRRLPLSARRSRRGKLLSGHRHGRKRSVSGSMFRRGSPRPTRRTRISPPKPERSNRFSSRRSRWTIPRLRGAEAAPGDSALQAGDLATPEPEPVPVLPAPLTGMAKLVPEQRRSRRKAVETARAAHEIEMEAYARREKGRETALSRAAPTMSPRSSG